MNSDSLVSNATARIFAHVFSGTGPGLSLSATLRASDSFSRPSSSAFSTASPASTVEACDRGVEQVADAPPELVAFLADMERKPDWLDMTLVEQGARIERNSAAHLGPFVIRGAFIATFMNRYAALPMAITGTLSQDTAARRVKETATFFTTSILPGALERFGPGFKAAAMVRLMHSMVRAGTRVHMD